MRFDPRCEDPNLQSFMDDLAGRSRRRLASRSKKAFLGDLLRMFACGAFFS